MSLDTIKNKLPEYAKDMRLNLGGLTTVHSMNEQQLWGTIVASAIASGNKELMKAAVEDASTHLSDEAMNAAKTAASLMGMNNIYYRFVHLMEKQEYSTMPARLRMNAISNPGVDKVDFELWSLAVSAINGCGMCLQAHENGLLKEGASKEAIQDAIRIASILHSVANTLDLEDAVAA